MMENTTDSRVPTRRYAEPFRSRRLQSDAFSDGLIISIDDETAGQWVGHGKDISVHGIKVLFDLKHNGRFNTLVEGAHIQNTTIRYFDMPVFSGSSRVRHVKIDRDDHEVGLELVGPDIALDLIYDTSQRLDFRRRMQHIINSSRDIGSFPGLSFRDWTLGCKTILENIRNALASEEKSLEVFVLVSKSRAINLLREESYALFIPVLYECRSELSRRADGMNPLENSTNQKVFREILGEYLFESTFISRAFNKPFGYAGDFELMSMLYRSEPEGNSLFSDLLNQHGKSELAGRATINRLEYVGRIIEEAVASRKGEMTYIASIGCGAACEISHLLSRKPELGKFINLTLLDQDARALEVCEKTLLPFSRSTGATFSFVGDPIQSLVNEAKLGQSLGQKDLVYSIGLYDYLNDNIFVELSRRLIDVVKSGGRLVIGNMATHNPSRHWMEYTADWFLIHRSELELLVLARDIVSHGYVHVDSEPAGVNLFLHIEKP